MKIWKNWCECKKKKTNGIEMNGEMAREESSGTKARNAINISLHGCVQRNNFLV